MIAGLLFWSVLAGAGAPPPGVPDTPTPPPVLAAVQLQVILRTANGAAVPGVGVILVPAAPQWGGPPAGPPARQRTTDTAGSATFADLGPWIWRVQFRGHYGGRPLQVILAQGRSPYGTTPGGGFVVRVQAQEEHVALGVEGQPTTPPIEVAVFVLLPEGAAWVPAIDLGLPTERPHPLAVLTVADTGAAAPTAAAPPGQTTRETAAGFDPWGIGLWILPALAAGIALWHAWQRRRSREPAIVPAAAAWEGDTDDHKE